MIPASSIVEADCTILLERALLGKTLCAFGEDGCGKYGRCECPGYFTVSTVDVTISTYGHSGSVRLALTGYDSTVTGHIATDRNFEISLAQHLTNHDIEPRALTWGNEELQGRSYVTMLIDVNTLLA